MGVLCFYFFKSKHPSVPLSHTQRKAVSLTPVIRTRSLLPAHSACATDISSELIVCSAFVPFTQVFSK